ncbi:helix-turn-helix domain-containing protein [Serratia ureilytica]
MNENDIFKALADPTRRTIFDKLAVGSMNASALREGCPSASPRCRNTAVLRNAGLVRETKQGASSITRSTRKGWRRSPIGWRSTAPGGRRASTRCKPC